MSHKKTILFLEDSYSLPSLAKKCGYETVLGKKSINHNPDLILLDIDLDKNKWKEFIKTHYNKIKKDTIPVIGYSRADERVWRRKKDEAVNAGCNTIISLSSLQNDACWQFALYTRPLDFSMVNQELPLGIKKGIELFNQGKFHEAHDEIEPIWLQERRDFRMLYQGILQIGIAFYQIEHEKYDVALRMFTCGKLKIRHFLPVYQGIDIKSLYLDSIKCEEKLKRLGLKNIKKFDRSLFPKIMYTN